MTEIDSKMVGRRRFLLLGIGGTAAALVGSGALRVSAASPTIVPVWRLSADWGYPVPPKNRTRCRCTACRNHAANKVFATKALALAGRIHPCCVCQPYSIDILATDYDALFASSPSGTIDLRHDESRSLFEAAVVRSLAPVPDSTTPSAPAPASPPPASTPAASPAPAPAIGPVDDPAQVSAAESSRSAWSLPVTGSDTDTLLAAAGVLVVAGVAGVLAASDPTSSN